MTIETLIATMKQDDFDFLENMNIESNAIVANQCDRFDYKEKTENEKSYKMISTPFRGVGKNRNLALYHSKADICLIADDDIQYIPGYIKIIEEAYNMLPDADIIIFNLLDESDFGRRINTKIIRLKWFNLLNYGAVRISFRRESIIRNSLSFSLSFGGGAPYSAGEDSLFLLEAYRKGLKIYAYPKTILRLNESESTWFKGYKEKYYFDKGKFVSIAFGKIKYFLLFAFFIKEAKKSEIGLINCAKWMLIGAKKKNKNKVFFDFGEIGEV